MTDTLITIAAALRVFALVGFVIAVLPKMFIEYRIPDDIKLFKFNLLASGLTLVVIMIGTTTFQICRLSFAPICHTELSQDILAVFNSLAFVVMFWFCYLVYNGRN